MRSLIATVIVLASFGPNLLLAQEQGKASLNQQQPAQTQGGPKTPTGADSQRNDEANRRHIMRRQGPAIDWDHRKPGRNWKISPRREDSTAKGDQD